MNCHCTATCGSLWEFRDPLTPSTKNIWLNTTPAPKICTGVSQQFPSANLGPWWQLIHHKEALKHLQAKV